MTDPGFAGRSALPGARGATIGDLFGLVVGKPDDIPG